jgi:fibronectin-binding autotransporter adhesin
VTIANPIILNSNDTQLQVLTGTATQSGDISETGGPRPLEKIGAGTLVLTGANTYTGPTTISAGTLVAGSNDALPMVTDVAVNGGGTLEIGNGIAAGINSLAGAGALVIGSSDPTTYLGIGFNGGATTTFSGSITGAGSLELVGGSLALTGASSISGDLIVCSCATLTISGPGASFAVAGNPFGLGGTEIDGTLNVQNGGAFTTNDLAVVGSMTVNGANSTATVNGLTLVGAIPSFTPASLTIENGGRMNSVGGAIIANDFSVPNVTVTGMGSVWQIGTALEVGDAFLSGLPGSLTISDRGVVNVSGTTTIASDPSLVGLGPSTLTVTGAGSALNTDALVIGTAGCGCGPFEGVLTIAEGGVVRATTGTQIGVLGVLNLGSGGLAGSIVTPTIANDGQIVANFTDALTLAADISGTGTLSKFGSGTLILSGNSTYTGPTSVVAGGLIVNGSLVSPVTVESGAFLGGTGSVGSTTINGGTLSPGNSIGALKINGNLVFSTASSYLVEVNAAGQSDRTNVTGTATLGGTVQVVAAPGAYAPGTTYTILNATGGISGTFAGLTGNLPASDFISPMLAYDSNNVFLSLAKTATLASAGLTRNQIATGSGVDSLGFGNPISDTLLLGTAAQARAAFDLLSGEVHASAAGMMLDESRYVRDAVIGRARQSYGGLQSRVLAALGPTTPAIAFAQETEDAFAALGYAAAKRPVYKAAPAAPTPNERVWTAWAQAIGAWGKTDGDGNAAALNRTAAGFVNGVDATFNGLWRLGLATGYTRSSLDVDARRSSAAMDNFHIALYGGTQQGPWGLRGGAAFTWHEIDTRRTIAFPGFFDATKANYNAHTAQVFGEIGYGLALGPTAALEPFAAIAYVNLDTDRFTETGGAASLTGGTTLDATFTTLGLRGATVLGFANGMAVTGRGTLGWRHALGDATPEMSLAFASGGIPFTIAGAPLAKNSAVVEAGLDLAVTANAKLGVVYSGQLADTAQDHAVKGNFLLRF